MNDAMNDARVLARRLLLVLVFALTSSALTAQAEHTADSRSVEESAYLLKSGEWQLGPLQLGVGFWKLELSTRVAPWIIGAALKKAMPNLRLDATVFDRNGFTLSLNGSMYYVNSNKLSDPEQPILHLFIFPVGPAFSWRINERYTVSLRATYVRIVTDQEADADDLEIESGRLADNFQLHASWEVRFTKVCALVTALRYLPYQGDPVVNSTVPVDARTTAEVQAEVNTENLQHSVAGSVSGVFSWKHFNLRAGLAYGALFLQGPGLVLPLKYPYPEIALYWRL